MKFSIYLTLALMCVATSTFAQDIQAIDRLRGFQDMNFGDPYTKWKDKVELLDQPGDGGKVYRLKEAPEMKVFGYAVTRVDLEFRDEKLCGIRLFCAEWTIPGSDTATEKDPLAYEHKCREELQSHGAPVSTAYGPASLTVGPQKTGDTDTEDQIWAGASFWKGSMTWIKVGTLCLPEQHSGWTFFHFEDRTVQH